MPPGSSSVGSSCLGSEAGLTSLFLSSLMLGSNRLAQGSAKVCGAQKRKAPEAVGGLGRYHPTFLALSETAGYSTSSGFTASPVGAAGTRSA